MNNEEYQDIAEQARQNVKVKFGRSRLLSNRKYRAKYGTLTGQCARVSTEVGEILRRRKIKSIPLSVMSGRVGGGNHVVILAPKDDVIIDGTINQYQKGNYRYVYNRVNYPFKIKGEIY